jgi:hypothetical protein
MDSACGNNAELVACDKIDSDDILIYREIVEDRACGIKNEDTSVYADRIELAGTRNGTYLCTDIGVIDKRIGTA